MFSVADLLDRALKNGHIESDYRLAQVIGITHSAISLMRKKQDKQAYPSDKVVAQLCALSGDDPQLIFAQIQESKAQTDSMKAFWRVMASRLSGAVTPAILAVVFAISLIAGGAGEARASGLNASKNSASGQFIHRIK